MSSTRHAAADAEFSQEKFCSSPAFNQGLNANLVAKRAQLVKDPELRAAIWYLQWRSLRDGGLAQVASDLIAQHKGKLGPASMLQLGCEPDRIYSAEEVRAIRGDFPHGETEFRLRGEIVEDYDGDGWEIREKRDAARQPTAIPAKRFIDVIAERFTELEGHLVRMCLDPDLELSAPVIHPRLGNTGNLWWFPKFESALMRYRQESMRAARARLADTSVSLSLLEHLDFFQRQRPMLVIEGNSGIGKSATVKTWTEMQGGLARYVEVPNSNDDRSFYVEIAEALGVACGTSYNVQQIKLKVESALEASGLSLVVDEAQFCWPQFVRPRGTPPRMQWIQTRFNKGTPLALIGFRFSKWRKIYTDKAGWPDEQFDRRLNRTIALPEMHSREDLLKIAECIHPRGDAAAHLYLAGVAKLQVKKGASAMVELMRTAQDLCDQAGQQRISFEMLERATRINHPGMIAAPSGPYAEGAQGSCTPSGMLAPRLGGDASDEELLTRSLVGPALKPAGRNPAIGRVEGAAAAIASS